MQSDRKKLRDFNQMPVSDIKAPDNKFKSQRKYHEKEHPFSKPYQPEVEQFCELQQIMHRGQLGIQFQSAFPLLRHPFSHSHEPFELHSQQDLPVDVTTVKPFTLEVHDASVFNHLWHLPEVAGVSIGDTSDSEDDHRKGEGGGLRADM